MPTITSRFILEISSDLNHTSNVMAAGTKVEGTYTGLKGKLSFLVESVFKKYSPVQLPVI